MFHYWQASFASGEELTDSPVWGLFLQLTATVFTVWCNNASSVMV